MGAKYENNVDIFYGLVLPKTVANSACSDGTRRHLFMLQANFVKINLKHAVSVSVLVLVANAA